ncbi:MAG TPA: TauD/TfdA family dioxygenase [Roseiflexaceae bacterium]|nr:TauD/TfdA family dioxygenase [Roseiflexaceae bacterium]
MSMPEKPKIGAFRRKAIGADQDAIVKKSFFRDGQRLPLIIEPTVEGVDLEVWSSANRAEIATLLSEHGGLLFRGFAVSGVEGFERFIKTVSDDDLLAYRYRSTPRTQVSGNIYTSTEYPADQHIPMHNEMSYTTTWPMQIWFYSVLVAQQGGETPIADSRRVYAQIDPLVRERFERKKVMYVRNYGQGLDLSWQQVFQTEDRAAVEAFCREHEIAFEWLGPERLRTRQVCQATARHPLRGEPVWFNQAHLFHVSSLQPAIRDRLLEQFQPDDLPRHACYGDGSQIEPEALEAIRAAFAAETIAFPWRQNDILMLDNMLVAHGRSPFVGPRKVVVGMATPYSAEQ